MASKSQAVDTGKLTERDRFWLGHHEACQASGQTGKVCPPRVCVRRAAKGALPGARRSDCSTHETRKSIRRVLCDLPRSSW
jgi:hypothetical protein